MFYEVARQFAKHDIAGIIVEPTRLPVERVAPISDLIDDMAPDELSAVEELCRRRRAARSKDVTGADASARVEKAQPPQGGAPQEEEPEVVVPAGSWAALAQGPLWGQLPDGLEGAVEDCLSLLFGQPQMRRVVQIEWAGWQRFAAQILQNQSLAVGDQLTLAMDALRDELPTSLRIAGDNMRDITAGRVQEHLARVQRDQMLTKGRGEVYGGGGATIVS